MYYQTLSVVLFDFCYDLSILSYYTYKHKTNQTIYIITYHNYESKEVEKKSSNHKGSNSIMLSFFLLHVN